MGGVRLMPGTRFLRTLPSCFCHHCAQSTAKAHHLCKQVGDVAPVQGRQANPFAIFLHPEGALPWRQYTCWLVWGGAGLRLAQLVQHLILHSTEL